MSAKWNFKRRPAQFGTFNNRWENLGKSGEKRKAIDLPVSHQVKKSEIDMVVPADGDGAKFSIFLYGEGRGMQRRTHILTPLKVHRKPEHCKITIYYDPNDKRKSMTFEEVKVKDPSLDLEEDAVLTSYKLQIRPTFEQFSLIAQFVENQRVDYEIVATQAELFDKKGEEGEEGEGGDQGDLPGTEGEPAAEDDDE